MRFAVADEFGAKQRAQTIGGDDRGAGKGAAVRDRQGDAVAAILEARDHGVGDQLDRIVLPAGVEQDVMHVDAMNDDVGMLEARAERRGRRNAYELLAVERVEHQQRGRGIRDGEHLVAQAEAVEDVKDVGPELDAVADGAEFRRAFEHTRGTAAPRQRQRRGEAAEPAADDQDGIAAGHRLRLRHVHIDRGRLSQFPLYRKRTSPNTVFTSVKCCQRATLYERYAAAGFELATRRRAAGPSHKQDRASGGHL